MLYETNTLVHHGILGMKWGVRRYQNKDGSLTPAGKRKLEKINKKYDNRRRLHEDTIKEESKNYSGYKKNLSDLKKNRTKSKVFTESWMSEDYDKKDWEYAVDRLIESWEEGRDISKSQIETSKKVLSELENKRINELKKYGLN